MDEKDWAAQFPDFLPPFEILQQGSPVPFIFNSPHSGRVYPEAFLRSSRLDALDLRKSEDCFVEELFAGVVGRRASLIHAHFPRAFLDINREPFELDPLLFADSLPKHANTQSVRVLGGLGTIARVVTESEEIYHQALPLAEGLARITHLYWPYHNALRDLVDEAKRTFGFAVLMDCHSMPSFPSALVVEGSPDIVLGDRFGTSCDGAIIDAVERVLSSLGYKVMRNKPYAGGYISEHYGQPASGVHALQIEISRRLYMDERSLEKTDGMKELQKDLDVMTDMLFDEIPQILGGSRLAAE